MIEDDTNQATLPAPPAPVARLPQRWPTWARVVFWLVLVGSVVGAAGTVTIFVVPAQWAGRVLPGHSVVDDDPVAFKPGGAQSAARRITISGAETFQPEGALLFTTVGVDDAVSIFEWIQSSLSDSIELYSRAEVFGDRSSAEQRQRDLMMMESSQNTAVLVALEFLGFEVFSHSGVRFGDVVEGSGAVGVLETSDVIVGFDGLPITTLASLLELLADREPGTTVLLTVEHAETLEQRDVELTLVTNPDFSGGFIGISTVQERIEEQELPFDVDIDLGAVGGSSAGLAFTLSILDLLTPGELTGGRKVAVTGTISLDGSVNDVGGVRQKAVAARRSGAEIFIVPAGSVASARSGAGDMPVRGVSSLDEALEVLSSYEGEVSDLLGV